MNQLSVIIRRFRENRGWNRSEIAKQLDISSQLYGQYEDNKRSPGGEFYIKWREVFGENLIEAIVSHGTTSTSAIPDSDFIKKTIDRMLTDREEALQVIKKWTNYLLEGKQEPSKQMADAEKESKAIEPGGDTSGEDISQTNHSANAQK